MRGQDVVENAPQALLQQRESSLTLCEADEHGSAMPCFSKEGLINAIKSQIESWSINKANCTNAIA